MEVKEGLGPKKDFIEEKYDAADLKRIHLLKKLLNNNKSIYFSNLVNGITNRIYDLSEEYGISRKDIYAKFETYKNCYNINDEMDLSMWKNSTKTEIQNCINEIKLYKNDNYNSILKGLNAMLQNDNKNNKKNQKDEKDYNVSEDDSFIENNGEEYEENDDEESESDNKNSSHIKNNPKNLERDKYKNRIYNSTPVPKVDIIIDNIFRDGVNHFYINYDKNSEKALINILKLFKKENTCYIKDFESLIHCNIDNKLIIYNLKEDFNKSEIDFIENIFKGKTYNMRKGSKKNINKNISIKTKHLIIKSKINLAKKFNEKCLRLFSIIEKQEYHCIRVDFNQKLSYQKFRNILKLEQFLPLKEFNDDDDFIPFDDNSE